MPIQWAPGKWRDIGLFVIGAVVVIHEVIWTSLDRPFVLTVGAACLGLPLVLKHDEGKAPIHERDEL